MPLPHRSRAADPASGERVRALLEPRPAASNGWVPGAAAPAPGRHARAGLSAVVQEEPGRQERGRQERGRQESGRQDAPAAGRHRASWQRDEVLEHVRDEVRAGARDRVEDVSWDRTRPDPLGTADDLRDDERQAQRPPAALPVGGRRSRGHGPAGPALATGLLDRWRGSRVDPGRRGVAALALVAVLAALLAGTVVVRGRPQELPPPAVVAPGVPVPGAPGLSGPAVVASGAASVPPGVTPPGASPGEVVVAVAGKVQSPGLVRLPAGSRVDDAVRAAGGPLPGVDLVDVNLARRLVDGEQVLVGVPQPAGALPGGPGPGRTAPGEPDAAPLDPAAGQLMDLNTATAAQLDGLPGLGPVLAQRVVDHRTERGPFASVEQLREVEGIGESKFAQLRELVRV